MRRRLSFLAAFAVAMALGAPAAHAAGAPEITATWVTTVTTTAANLRAEVNPSGLATTYRFEYTTEAAFEAKGFTAATKAPAGSEPNVGAGEDPVPVVQHIGGLEPGSLYRYRVVAANTAETVFGPARPLGTDENTPVFSLPDARGWEMVSPGDKNGGQIAAPEALYGGGVFQAAAGGGAVTYGSAFSFADGLGSSVASQYLSRRGSGGWATENVTAPALSGSYPSDPDSGVPYQLFSDDLSGALLSNGKRCRGEATQCPVANPPLAGSGAPAGYRNYYLRTNAGGTFKALLGVANVSGLQAEKFETAFVGATPDLSQVILSSCSALTPNATEVPGTGDECDPAKQNLYRYSSAGLSLVNLLPGQATGTPGATIAAQGGAISANGSRVYWSDGANLYLRDGSQTVQVDESLGGGGAFQTATPDGSVAFFSKAEHLYRYDVAGGSATDLTPGGGMKGVLGSSTDGSYLYYLAAGGLLLRHGAMTTLVASAADAGNYPPATGTARISADGTHLAFLSSAELTGYDSQGKSEVYLYSASPSTLTCASCNPSGERPVGPSSIPGAVANGSAFKAYKPRALSTNGSRLFFDSADSLVPQDSNNEPDVYQWEAQGSGSCARPSGCVNLISSGRASEGATFLDASAAGGDAFFLTDGSLVPADLGALDVYDARVGGGFPVGELPIPCVGDACQVVPGEPEDATPGTILVRPEGNPALNYPKAKKTKKRKTHHKKHRNKGHHKKQRGRG